MSRTPLRPPPVTFSSPDSPTPPRRASATKTVVARPSAKAASKTVVRRSPQVLEPSEILAPVKPLTEREARLLTDEIKARSVQLWHLVSRAHEGRAYTALGYATWKEYTEKELDISESRSFQLLDQAKVMRELTAAGADLENVTPPPARVVQRIKHNLPEVREFVRESLSRGEDVLTALRAYARMLEEADRTPPPAPRKSEARMVNCPACEGTGHVTARDSIALKRRLGL